MSIPYTTSAFFVDILQIDSSPKLSDSILSTVTVKANLNDSKPLKSLNHISTLVQPPAKNWMPLESRLTPSSPTLASDFQTQ
jgi:hypothetical protein